MGEMTAKLEALCDSYETEIMDHLNAIVNVIRFVRELLDKEDTPVEMVWLSGQILNILEDYVTSEIY